MLDEQQKCLQWPDIDTETSVAKINISLQTVVLFDTVMVKKKKKNPYRHCPQDLTHIHYWLLCSDRCKMILKLFCQRLAWPNPTNWVTVCVHFTSHDLQTDRMQDHERAKEGNLIKVVKKTEQGQSYKCHSALNSRQPWENSIRVGNREA